jgi:hypothetical protein
MKGASPSRPGALSGFEKSLEADWQLATEHTTHTGKDDRERDVEKNVCAALLRSLLVTLCEIAEAGREKCAPLGAS